jgi:hypothetical protein
MIAKMKKEDEDSEDMDMSSDDMEDAEEETGEDLDGDNEEGEPEEHKKKVLGSKGGDVGGGMGDAGPMFSKKKSKKASKKKMQKEATEDEKWWNSVRSMTGSSPDTKYNDGWTEYQSKDLFTPVDTENLTQAVRPEPGSVGYPVQNKLGDW